MAPTFHCRSRDGKDSKETLLIPNLLRALRMKRLFLAGQQMRLEMRLSSDIRHTRIISHASQAINNATPEKVLNEDDRRKPMSEVVGIENIAMLLIPQS